MGRRSVDELMHEMKRLMQEHIESLKAQEFVPPDEEQAEHDKKLLALIREVSAEFLAEFQRAQAEIEGDDMKKKPSVTLPGKVEKVIGPMADEPEKVQISIDDADHLYRELRIENSLKDSTGEEVRLQEDQSVDVTVEAEKPEEPQQTDMQKNQAQKRRTA